MTNPWLIVASLMAALGSLARAQAPEPSPEASGASQEAAEAPEDVPGLVAYLLERADDADSDLIRKLANIKTREALDGLLQVYPAMASIYMRRVIVQGLMLYDDVPGADQVALQKLMDVATGEKEVELRMAAVDTIADCEHLRKAFLRAIVESAADDDVRERAMLHHTGQPRPEDVAWYREVYEAGGDRDRGRKGRGKDEVDVRWTPALRALAFEALASDMELSDVVKATEDGSREIRLRAMKELDARGGPDVAKVAEGVYERRKEPAPTRILAARIMARIGGTKVAERLLKDGVRRDTPRELSLGIAEVLADLADPAVEKKVVKGFGKGNEVEKLFYLAAARNIQDPKIDKALIKLIGDKEPEVQISAMAAAADRGLVDAIPEMLEVVHDSVEPDQVSSALEAISRIRPADRDWKTELAALTHHESEEVRNAAIGEIGRIGDPGSLPVLEEALENEQWSTRLVAARAIARMRTPEGVGALCERIPKEDGRMLRELADLLWRLTGQPFETNADRWLKWWQSEGPGFEVIDEGELARLEQERERRRLMERTTSEFFGIRIVSHRVLFIVDVSGSMTDPTRGKAAGEIGPPRIDVAREELKNSLERLDPGSLFNVVTFSGGVDAWSQRVRERTEASLKEAEEYVDRLGAFGGTNLYEALQLAFEDPVVDTIFLLSDGEPTVGAVQDPYAIREEVASWNKHRGVVINCIAVGGGLDTLEWLAEDSGGTYVKIP